MPLAKLPLILAAIYLLSCASAIRAQVPQFISYQGRIAVSGTSFNGAGQFKFALVNGTPPTATYWSNDGTSTAGSQPTNAVTLPVTNGLYTVLLGDTTLANMTAVPNSVFSNSDVRLRVWFNDGTNGWQQFTPDQRIAAVGYAVMANGVPNGAITSAMIADGAVGSAKLAAKAVQASNIADGAVGSAQIANGSIGSAQLAVNVGGSQTFSTTGTFTAPPGVTIVFVTLIGGGGGGGAGDQILTGDLYGGGGGGGGGIVLNCPVSVTPGNQYVITIGLGGAGAPAGQTGGSPPWSGQDGSAGGNTSFASLVSVNGGGGGSGGTGINQGGGGAGGGGGSATPASPFANTGYIGNSGGGRGGNGSLVGGGGAESPFGSGGSGASGANVNGGDAAGYGAGGGGGAPSNNNNGKGGNGSAGYAIIRY